MKESNALEIINSKKNDPLVSVVIATYNDAPQYIEESLGSIKNQTYKNIEVFVMDDSNKEDTIQAIDKFSEDERFHIVRTDKKMGFVRALNKGLELTSGDYIARMDSDDVSVLDRFEHQVMLLKENPEISVLGGQLDIINERGDKISHRRYPTKGIKLFLFSLARSPLAHPTVMMRREVIDSGLRYDEKMKKAEDIDMWLKVLNKGFRIANTSKVLVRYRIESGFNEKRSGEQQKFVAYARRRNFCIKRPLFSVFSVIITTIYRFTPYKVLSIIYNHENRSEVKK